MKRKKRYNFFDPKVIVMVTVSLTILGAGVFAFFTVWDSLTDDSMPKLEFTTCRPVSTPSANQTIVLTGGESIVYVTETLSNGSSRTIPSGNYTFYPSNYTIVVEVTG